MYPQTIDVNAAYEYRGTRSELKGEHCVALGFVNAGKMMPMVLVGFYYPGNDKLAVYRVYAYELDPIWSECECGSCTAYLIADQARQALRDKGTQFVETYEQTEFYQMEA